MSAKVYPFVTPQGPVAAPSKTKTIEPYGFDAGFERALVTALCKSSNVSGRLLRFLEPDGFSLPASQLAVKALQAFVKDRGKGPDNLLLVVQRCRRWVEDGKITEQSVDELNNLFDDALDLGMPSDESLVAEVAPIVRRRVERNSLEEILALYKDKKDLRAPMQKLDAAMRIEEVDNALGDILETDGLDILDKARNTVRLSTGIVELDDLFDGGPRRGSACMFLGASSAGKSIGLVHVGVAGALAGINVAVATLELPREVIIGRFIANMTDIETDLVLDEPMTCGAKQKLQAMHTKHNIGRIVVKEFSSKVATTADIFNWVETEEKEREMVIDLLIVDYGDKVRAVGGGSKKDESSYASQGNAYDQMFGWARDNGKWLWTASAATRNKDRKRELLSLDDVADSLNKVKNFDVVVTLNPADQYTMMVFGVEKNRVGKRGGRVGPLPVDFERARIAPCWW